jgi:hypothetical protein
MESQKILTFQRLLWVERKVVGGWKRKEEEEDGAWSLELK